MKKVRRFQLQINAKRGQILLPSVLLVPIFILVVYLLYDLTNLSLTKVQHQFALDTAAYAQMSSVSSYLNSMAIINGPSLYRVMLESKQQRVSYIVKDLPDPENVFNLFYKAGLFPSVGKDHENGSEANPAPESIDWDVAYYPNPIPKDEKYPNLLDDPGHSQWMVPHPSKLDDNKLVAMMNRDLVKNSQLSYDQVLDAMYEYLKWDFYVGNIYTNLTYSYKQLVNNAYIFRAGYFANMIPGTCDIKNCGSQSAKLIMPYLKIAVEPYEVKKMLLYLPVWREGFQGAYDPYPFVFDVKDYSQLTQDVFMFSHLNPKSLSLLQKLDRGVGLKQSYKTGANHFNKNLNLKYKPMVHTTVYLQCPRKGNNCVWPNPLPKYSIFLRP